MERIGKYEVLGVLGQGGMGAVYRARDPDIGREVAIKVIHDRAMDTPAVRARFDREARLAGALSHENVMTLYDVGEDGGRPFLVMELLDGTDLRHLLDARPLPPLDTRLDLAVQVARGLAYAHARGVVHRDVKPENIRVTSGGRAKLLDFGIAWAAAEAVLTRASGQLGTPRYMSPEQIRGEPVDHRTDVFSFGVVLYELLTGSAPFSGDHLTTIIHRVIYEEPGALVIADPPAASAASRGAQRELQQVVAQCLAKDPKNRYSSLLETAGVIQQVRMALGNAAAKPPPAPREPRSPQGGPAPPTGAPPSDEATLQAPSSSTPAPRVSAGPRRPTRGDVNETILEELLASLDLSPKDALPPPAAWGENDTVALPPRRREPPAEGPPEGPVVPPPYRPREPEAALVLAQEEPALGTGRRRTPSSPRVLVVGAALLALGGLAATLLMGRSGGDELEDAATEETAALEASAAEELARMGVARDSAAAAGADTSAAFRQAEDRARAAEAALAQGDGAGFTRAAEAAREAAALFVSAGREAVVARGTLRQQAVSAEGAALAAQRAAANRRSDPAAAALAARAEGALAAGRRAWADSSFAEAARLFGEAERGFREAGAARGQDRSRADAERAQREALDARVRARATDWNGDDYRLSRQAEEQLRTGDRLLRQGNYSRARAAYNEAARIFTQVSTAPTQPPAPADTSGDGGGP